MEETAMTTLWKIACKEDKFPGMWQRWFKNQCVAVGWHSCKLNGKTKGGKGWSAARKAIKEMNPRDLILVTLKGNRIGRIGEIVDKKIEDNQWDPLVPRGNQTPNGEMGRRIMVRWELMTGPSDTDMVIRVPPECRFTNGELRPTVSRIRSQTIEKVRSLMNDPRNWVGLLGKFGHEKALSDYIATYPHHLEDGLLPHPNAKIRERTFKKDDTRLDVLLLDRNDKPVIVECKQHAASVEDIKQVHHYVSNFEKEEGQKARGILVHSGAQKLTKDVIDEAKRRMIEVVCYRLRVEFTRSTT